MTGRFWSPDPKGKDAADPSNATSWNLYTYVNGDPVNFSDPTGEDSQCGPNGTWMGEGCYVTGGAGPGSISTNTSTIGQTSYNLNVGEANYIAQTVVPGYLSSALSTAPSLQSFSGVSGAPATWTICYGCDANGNVPTSVLSSIASALLAGPQMFYSGFVNALLNDQTGTGALQVAGSLLPAAAGGAATGLLSTLPATTGSTLIVGQTPVIGGLAYTSQYAGTSGYNVLSVSSSVYTFAGSNVPWLNAGIASGQSFLVGVGGPGTAAETEYLEGAGFSKIGSFLVPKP